ncbi:MAG: ABC transporter ATP-binding protein [Planctomycetota bacterium]|nr:MAG: ABC transporter ATP-binding protein [Planctomycetota bacterium]
MASLELRGLRKSFGGRPVVRNLSLRVEDGEFLVLVGPSGCGKSTLLRLIAGLESPDAGEVAIDGRVVNELEPGERDVAMVFQNYALYPHMKVLANVAFPLKMAGVPRRERERRAREALALLGIAELAGRKPALLSGGQQQRVALARALVRRPKLFLLDEPLSNVDARLRAEMRAELARLHRDLAATMVYVTHDQVEAMTLGGRIAVLAAGELQQVGPPLEVYRRPVNRFVAGFLGAPPMNLVEGEAAAALGAPGVVAGFRPEEAVLGGPLAARVTLVEELGSESLVHAEVAGGRDIVLVLPPGEAPSVGAELSVGVPTEALHRFDPGDGRRID